jgi:nucleoside-diphosphate-sugar epimerase
MALENTVSSVGIIGCGWLGTALAKALLVQNIKVLATRSRIENLTILTEQGINAEVLLLPVTSPDAVAQLNQHPVFKQENLVIAITPQFRQGRADYAEKVAQLVNAAKHQDCVKRIILLSSTAVYNGLCQEVTEASHLDFSADKVQLLHVAEKAVLDFAHNSDNKKSYVLRLAGLVGPNRHPGKFLLKGRMLQSPQAKVNLIHQQDAQGLILSLLTTNSVSGIFNGVSQTHVSKKDYYQAAAKALSLAEPIFSDDEVLAPVRIVSGNKAESILSYQFVYPDLLTWL